MLCFWECSVINCCILNEIYLPFEPNISQVCLNQEDLNVLFRILSENLGETPEELDKVKPRVPETGKRCTVGG